MKFKKILPLFIIAMLILGYVKSSAQEFFPDTGYSQPDMAPCSRLAWTIPIKSSPTQIELSKLSVLDKNSLPDLLSLLQSTPYKKIVKIGPAALPLLKEAIEDPNLPINVRQAAVYLVGEILILDNDNKEPTQSKEKVKQTISFLVNLVTNYTQESLLNNKDFNCFKYTINIVIEQLRAKWKIPARFISLG